MPSICTEMLATDGWIERLHKDNHIQKMSFVCSPLIPCIIYFVSKQRQWVSVYNSATACRLFTSNSLPLSFLLLFQTALGDWQHWFKKKRKKKAAQHTLMHSSCFSLTFASTRASRFQHKEAEGKALLPLDRPLMFAGLPGLPVSSGICS